MRKARCSVSLRVERGSGRCFLVTCERNSFGGGGGFKHKTETLHVRAFRKSPQSISNGYWIFKNPFVIGVLLGSCHVWTPLFLSLCCTSNHLHSGMFTQSWWQLFPPGLASCNYRICCLNVENMLEATTTSQVPFFPVADNNVSTPAQAESGSGSVFWKATGVDFSAGCSASFCKLQPWCLAGAVGVFTAPDLQILHCSRGKTSINDSAEHFLSPSSFVRAGNQAEPRLLMMEHSLHTTTHISPRESHNELIIGYLLLFCFWRADKPVVVAQSKTR